MAYNFFAGRQGTSVGCQPDQYWREMEQARIENEWDNTAAKADVQEETAIGSFQFQTVEVWMDYIVGMTSTGLKNGNDFRKLLFKDIDHPIVRGRYYQFDDNYWIGDFTDERSAVSRYMSVRRCNNYMRIIDPETGDLFSIPCVIDYDMTSPSAQVSTAIITPNNHAVVMVQGNERSYRLFKTNRRFVFNGRPFKLLAYQNTIMPTQDQTIPTLLYLDLYLDEIHPQDDLENGIAYNGEWDYTVRFPAQEIEVAPGSQGKLVYDILLNGVEVSRPLYWTSSNPEIAEIASDGSYSVADNAMGSALITASIEPDGAVKGSVRLMVIDTATNPPSIMLNPMIQTLKEYETVEIEVEVVAGGQTYAPDEVKVSLNKTAPSVSNAYLTVSVDGAVVTIVCNHRAKDVKNVYITVHNTELGFDGTLTLPLKLTSMLG